MISEIVCIFGFSDDHAEEQDVDLIAEEHRKLESARRMIFSLVTSKGGRAIGQVHGREIVVVPVDQSDVIKEVHERLTDELGIANTVGVGEDAKQAMQALDYAKGAAPGSIKVYTPTMADDGDGDMVKPESVVTGEQGIPVQKSERYVPISQDEKTQIAQILQAVQANKQVFDALKQQSPDVYANVVAVIQSLTAMLAEDKKDQEAHVANMIKKITKYLDKQSTTHDEKYAKEIQREIDRQAVKAKSEEGKKEKEHWERSKAKRKAEREHLRKNPTHKLFFDLSRGKI